MCWPLEILTKTCKVFVRHIAIIDYYWSTWYGIVISGVEIHNFVFRKSKILSLKSAIEICLTFKTNWKTVYWVYCILFRLMPRHDFFGPLQLLHQQVELLGPRASQRVCLRSKSCQTSWFKFWCFLQFSFKIYSCMFLKWWFWGYMIGQHQDPVVNSKISANLPFGTGIFMKRSRISNTAQLPKLSLSTRPWTPSRTPDCHTLPAPFPPELRCFGSLEHAKRIGWFYYILFERKKNVLLIKDHAPQRYLLLESYPP